MSVGEENGPQLRVYGCKASIEWNQLEPNTLIFKSNDGPRQFLRTGWAGTDSAFAAYNTRVPAGHPEGFIEAFANLYRNFATSLAAVLDGKKVDELDLDFPTADDGVRGLSFIESVVASAASDKKWLEMAEYKK